MKQNDTIYLLPHDKFSESSYAEHIKAVEAKWEIAKTLDYIPTSLEELKQIDFFDLYIMMIQNEKFYNAAVVLCQEPIERMIRISKKIAAEGEIDCEPLDDVQTLEELLNTNYFGDDYESSRREFISTLVDVYLYN